MTSRVDRTQQQRIDPEGTIVKRKSVSVVRSNEFNASDFLEEEGDTDIVVALSPDLGAQEAADLALAIALAEEKAQAEPNSQVYGEGGYSSESDHGDQEAIDFAMAMALSERLEERHVPPVEEEATTPTGKAVVFAEQIITEHSSMLRAGLLHTDSRLVDMASLVSADDVVWLAEKMFMRQEKFARAGKKTRVTVGYMHIESNGISRIRTDGLMTKATRDAPFGGGIYLSNNPFVDPANLNPLKGNKVLMVAKLLGKVDVSGKSEKHASESFDTVVARAGALNEVCVLRRSSQCVPLVHFDSALIDMADDESDTNNLIHSYHCHLQSVLDKCFNAKFAQTTVNKVLPSQVRNLAPLFETKTDLTDPLPSLKFVIYYTAPQFVDPAAFKPTEAALGQLLVKNTPSGPHDCELCGVSMRSGASAGLLPKCSHGFHVKCLFQRVKRHAKKCPVCFDNIGTSLPTGAMLIDANSKPSTLVVDANIDLAQQKLLGPSEMEKRHCSSSMSYISVAPSQKKKEEGFKCAYVCGSTFDVSLAYRQADSTIAETWSAMFDSSAFLERIQARVQGHATKCSTCRAKKTEAKMVVGVMPSGAMRVDDCPGLTCSGYERGSIRISYRFEGGTQKNYHGRPGDTFFSAHREAYLPDNDAGRDLLKRLKFAFSHGHTFGVGTSLTTGEPNSVTWSIPHKTSLDSNNQQTSFPDPGYFAAANEAMDSLGVPAAGAL